MFIDIGLFILSSLLIYILFRLAKYDSLSNTAVSEKIIIFLHIFIPYLFIFLCLIVGFYLDLDRTWGGFGILSALFVCKFLPNLSLLFSATKVRKDFLCHYFRSNHTNIIYGYLLAVLVTSICQKCPSLIIAVTAYIVGIFLNCNFYLIHIQNMRRSFRRFIRFCQNHWKALIYAAIICFVFWGIPILDSFVLAHLYAIATPPLLVVIGGAIYIAKVKFSSKKEIPIVQ